MKYLITGGAGFIGSTLADSLLADGHEITVVDNFSDYYDISLKETNVVHNINNKNYILYRSDIEDKAKLSDIFKNDKFDAVIHLAARAGVRSSLEAPSAYIRSNIIGTVNVLDCMKDYGVKKLVFASSSSVYGNCKEDKFSEDLKVTEPISPYAATKSACEQICYTWHHLYDISIVALRFFTVYGPRQRPDLAINKFAHLIDVNLPVEMYGDGSTMRDYTYIDDIISGIKSAINYDKSGYEIISALVNVPHSVMKQHSRKRYVD